MTCTTPDEIAALEASLQTDCQNTWNRLRDAARRHREDIPELALAMLVRHVSSSPASFFALLLDIAAKEESRRPRLFDIYRTHLSQHPAAGMGAAGYNLHEYNCLLTPGWIELAKEHFSSDPAGAWGIVEAAALYRQGVLDPAMLGYFSERWSGMPRAYFISCLSLCGTHCDPGRDLLMRTLAHFSDDPRAAIDAASFVVSPSSALLTPIALSRILELLPEAPEQAWEFFKRASAAKPGALDAECIAALCMHASDAPGEIFAILHHCFAAGRADTSHLLEEYSRFVQRFPQQGIESAKYHFQTDDIALIRPHLIQAICSGFAAAAYSSYQMLQRCCDHRPELIGMPEIDAAISNIEHATNYAFGFFTKVIAALPDFTSECVLALFDCLAREPVHRAFMRGEELETIILISEGASCRTSIEQALRHPTRKGSRRARALMRIMFRQKLRSHRHLLLEALRYAGTTVMNRTRTVLAGTDQERQESEKYSPIWDFLMFIIDNSGDDDNSTSAAERFLEGTFQLHYLYSNPHEHRLFLAKLDIGEPVSHMLPEPVACLAESAEFCLMNGLLHAISERFAVPCSISAIEDFTQRRNHAETELRRLRQEMATAAESRRGHMAARERKLTFQLACWDNPAYEQALADPRLAATLNAQERAFLKDELKNLIKNSLDSVHAESVRVAVTAVDRLRLELYRLRVKEFTDAEVDIAAIDPKVLPAFLWFGAVRGMHNNTKYLKRLIEDRLTAKPHDWLRTEEPVLAWMNTVRAARPQIKLEHWRAPFSRQIDYRARDSRAEKQRRLAIDLAQTRALLEKAGARDLTQDSYDHFHQQYELLKQPRPATPEDPKEELPPPVPPVQAGLLDEIAMNLERMRLIEKSSESDFEGILTLSVESDPFEILFMGEYGFASCLSLRGINAWSAVSNAIDVDKTVVWAKEPGGNVVGRRLLALTPDGLLAYNTYTNKNGLSLNHFFDEFIDAYAEHCGTVRIHHGHPRELLSDRWYDDGCL